MADVSVQRGTSTIAASATSVTITAGTDYTAPAAISKAFIRITGVNFTGEGIGTNFAGPPDNWTVYITNPGNLLTSITLSRGNAYTEATRVSWEIIEYTGSAGGAYEFIVRHEEVLNLSITDKSKDTGTVSGVSTAADVCVFITSQACTDAGSSRGDSEEFLHTSEYISGSTIARVTRGASTNRSSVCTVAVVEFTGSNWLVQRETHTYTSADTNETETIGTTLGAVAQTFIHPQLRVDEANAGPDVGGQQVWISSTTQLTCFVEAVASGTNGSEAVIWIIEDTSGDMSVEQISGSRTTGSEPDSWTETISSVTLADASIMGECGTQDGGAGQDSYQVAVGMEITAATTLTLYRGDTSKDRQYRVEIVQWPTSAGGTNYTVDHVDGIFMDDFTNRLREIVFQDAMQLDDDPLRDQQKLTVDQIVLNDSLFFSAIRQLAVEDQILINDSRFTAIDKVLVDNLFTSDAVIKALELLKLDNAFLYDSVNTEITTTGILQVLVTDGLLMSDEFIKTHESVFEDSMLLNDETFRDTLLVLLDRLSLDDSIKDREYIINRTDSLLIDDLMGQLREILLEEDLLLSDSVTTQRVTASIAVLVYAKLRSIDLLGTKIQSNDNYLGVTISNIDPGGYE